jgi:hypothetical protein
VLVLDAACVRLRKLCTILESRFYPEDRASGKNAVTVITGITSVATNSIIEITAKQCLDRLGNWCETCACR